jgi:hypothetical protein
MRDGRAADRLRGRIAGRVVLVNYPSTSGSAHVPGDASGVGQVPRTAVHTLSVDPHRSMKAATASLETALERLGAEMDPESRRVTALLASELIAQVSGGDLQNGNGGVDLTARFRPNMVRLETRGPALPSATRGADPEAANGFAEWGPFVLNRLATRWGIDGRDPAILWAEVELPAGPANGR